tara:strand:+ start:290 stop:748 length:459 start_codon:yes stop_codon:yes gene_type:complete
MVNKMKKMIYVLVISLLCLTIFSCAKKSDKSSTSTTSFAPPSWIQGAWVDNVSSSSKSGYKFDSSDVYVIFNGQLIETGYVAAGAVTKHLTSTESEFSYSSPVSGTSGSTSYSGTLTYVFTKETTSTIKLAGSSTTSYVSITETTYTKDTSL